MKSQTKLDNGQLRQGDVMLVRTGDAKSITPAESRVVLKEGEVTGHAHAFMAESRVSFLGREREQLAVGAPSMLRHEEHSVAAVPAGIYDLPAQVEWSDANEPIPVTD